METTKRRRITSPPKQITTWSEAFKHTQHANNYWSNGSAYADDVATKYRIISQKMIDNGEDDPLIEDLTWSFVKDLLLDLQDERELQDKTLNRFLSVISKVMNQLAVDRVIDYAPVFQRWPEDEGRTNWYSKEQVTRLSELAVLREKFHLSDLLFFAAYSGLRRTELVKLRVGDVDWHYEHGPMMHVGGKPHNRTKARNHRVVGINEKLFTLLERRTQGREGSERVFYEWTSANQISKAFLPVRKRLSREVVTIDDTFCFHTLRHTYGTWLCAAGVPTSEVKNLMGHKRIETTEKYLHNIWENKPQLAQAI